MFDLVAKKTPPCPVSANSITSKLIENGRHRNVDKQVGRDVNAEIALRGSITTGDKSLTEYFTEAEMQAAVSHLKSGKAQGPDRIAPEFISNCGMLMLNWLITLITSDGQVSRLRRIHNGVPQGSTLAPTLFNIYISDIPKTTSKQYGYVDDLALLAAHQTWEKVEETLNQDMQSLSEYLSRWRLKLSTAKTTTTAFHLNNRDTHRQLDVVCERCSSSEQFADDTN